MKWNKYTILTTTQAEDFLSVMLNELGIEGIEIEDNIPLTKEDQAEMFIDFLPELPEDDGSSKVSFYLEGGKDHTQILNKVSSSLEEWREFTDIGEGIIISSETEDIDWMNNWKQFFHPFTIDNILIKPTWETVENIENYKTVIEIDPGISFGTGKHETTQLCIKQLIKYLEAANDRSATEVLDVGCGSGILSIAALKLGAGHVVGTDIDENCMQSARDNMVVNHLPMESADFYFGNLIGEEQFQEKIGKECYDIVVANILADVIIPMAGVIPDRLKKGGVFITSGIIDFKENDVCEAIKNAGMEILEINHMGEWVNITARRPF
ncbi:MAG: 50S ribosomal protein L11 methyltransferase [Lachnospiraceae bacterium]